MASTLQSSAHVRAVDRPYKKPDHTYSLVIFPTGDRAKVLQQELDALSAKHGGKSVPVHLTLMGGIVDTQEGAEERAKLLASQLKIQRIFFDKVVSRPITLYGKNVSSVAVSVDGELGFGEFGALAHPTYVVTPMLPRVAHLHISLLYSSTIDEATLNKVVEKTHEKLLGSDGLLHPAEYTITELALVETTDDDPTKWPVLGTYQLQPPDEGGPSA